MIVREKTLRADRKDNTVQETDGIPVRLKEPLDLAFLSNYGRVFKVYDQQQSGNLCFGVAQEGRRIFVKYAGARTLFYQGEPEDAVERLKATVPIYRDLAHPRLIRMLSAGPAGDGFALVFDWVDAICADKKYPEDHARFVLLPVETRLQIFAEILEFHIAVAARRYVALDFYDGNILWDEQNRRTIVCDIDFYQRSPYVGSMGLWGSTRFISPEERTTGARIDEITNVYTMGATAFSLFADSCREEARWPFSAATYDVVRRAVRSDRSQRQQSIRQLRAEWMAALDPQAIRL